MPTITPSLWFDNDLEDAMAFYTSIFPNSSIEHVNRYTDAGPGAPGVVVPTRLLELTGDADHGRAVAATQAMLGMRKIVIADVEAAANR